MTVFVNSLDIIELTSCRRVALAGMPTVCSLPLDALLKLQSAEKNS